MGQLEGFLNCSSSPVFPEPAAEFGSSKAGLVCLQGDLLLTQFADDSQAALQMGQGQGEAPGDPTPLQTMLVSAVALSLWESSRLGWVLCSLRENLAGRLSPESYTQLVTALQGSVLGQLCLIPLLTAQMRGLRAPLVSLNQAGQE